MQPINRWIYSIFILYLSICAVVIYRRMKHRSTPYLLYLLLLTPAFMLLWCGIQAGVKELPQFKLMIHGYKVPLKNDRTFYIGSADTDDIQFHYSHKGREQFTPGLMRVRFDKSSGGAFKIIQNNLKSENVICINGRPLRAVELTPGQRHKVTFGAFKYRLKDALEIEVHNRRPVFRYQGREIKRPFRRDILGGLVSLPMGANTAKHLAWRNRIDFAKIKDHLKQAALYWDSNGKVWLAANDANIKFNGNDFPRTRKISGGKCNVTLYSRQLGPGRVSVAFDIEAPAGKGQPAFIQLSKKSQRTFLLPDTNVKKICLTGSESPFRNAHAIFDFQFPSTGVMLKKEESRFIFRGENIKLGKLYDTGKTVFSIDDLHRQDLTIAAWLGILFLLSALFTPPQTVRKEAFIGIVISAAVFLMSFRMLLAFRAWQGPPFNRGVFADSVIAPCLFFLTVIIISWYYPFWRFIKRPYYWLWNLFMMHNQKTPANSYMPFYDKHGGVFIFAIIVYGMVLSLLLPDGASMELWAITGLLVFVLALNMFDRMDAFLEEKLFKGPLRILVIFGGFICLMLAIAPLLGGREVIAWLPGRPRPDIILQIILIFLAAFLADHFKRKYPHEPLKLRYIWLYFAALPGICVLQGFLAHDMGFILMVWPPVFAMFAMSIWYLRPVNKQMAVILTVFVIAGLVAGILMLYYPEFSPTDSSGFNRLLFIMDKQRLKAEYFFDFMANLPVIWSSGQGFSGAGFFHGLLDQTLRNTCVNDHVASVFIQGELGAVGTILTLSVYLALTGAAMLFIYDAVLYKNLNRAGSGFRLWVLCGLALTIFWTAAYMFIANMGFFPLTSLWHSDRLYGALHENIKPRSEQIK